MAINYDGQDIPSYVKVLDIEVGLAPSILQNTIEIPGRPGVYDFGNRIQERKIVVKYAITADSQADLRTKAREFAKWAYERNPKKLYLLDEPDKYYWAKLTGTPELNEVYKTGTGTLEFLCADPFAYKDETPIDFNPATSDPITITNNGFFTSYPRFELEFSQQSTELEIRSNDEFMYFGQPPEVDKPAPAPKRVSILHDDCSSVAPWTTAVAVDGGTITGGLESSGTYIRQLNLDYGSGSTWHGGSGIRYFAGGKELQDFTVEADIGFNPAKFGGVMEIGRLEIYLLDKNGVQVGKMAMKNLSGSTERNWVECRAGRFSNGNLFANTHVNNDYFKDFFGTIRVQRFGKTWKFFVGKSDGKGGYTNVYNASYYDKGNSYQDKIAGIQIHFGAYGTSRGVMSNYISDIRVYEENVITDPSVVPQIFQPGDKLIIDCATGSITLNGEPFYYALDPSSSFIRLELGDNQVSVNPPILTNSKIYYSQRWL